MSSVEEEGRTSLISRLETGFMLIKMGTTKEAESKRKKNKKNEKKKKMLMCNVSSLVTYSVTTACRIRSLALVRLWHVPKREQWKK